MDDREHGSIRRYRNKCPVRSLPCSPEYADLFALRVIHKGMGMSGAVDEVIFEQGKVSVSRTTLRVKRKTYSIAGIGSVEVQRGKVRAAVNLMIVSGIASAIILSSSDHTIRGWGYGLAILAALFAISALVQPHRLMIRTASGELQAMDGKKAELQRVKEAIEKAFSLRG